MLAVLLSADLMVVSRVEGAAVQAGVELQSSGSVPRALELLGESPVDLLIVDLSLPALTIDALVEKARTSQAPALRIMAFGPHVHEDRLAAARTAGCDAVLSRGQFFAQVDQLLRAM